jgi:hypothetical protein
MHTEDEAKTKWCQQTGHDPQRNPDQLHPSQACIGSACMAWRPLKRLWIDPDKPGFRYAANHNGELQEEPARGFCGLSGAPS